jgi:hypothetical protein
VEKRIVIEEVPVPFTEETVSDPSMDVGTQNILTTGVPGTMRRTHEVTLTDGKETARKLVKEELTVPPQAQRTAVGTRQPPPPGQASECDSNYEGACVPIASDVDCASGSGDGPAYVSGPVRVVGSDIYGLDRDNDGVGCETG